MIAAKNLVTNPAPAIHVSSDRTAQSSQNQHEITFDKKAEGAGVEPGGGGEKTPLYVDEINSNKQLSAYCQQLCDDSRLMMITDRWQDLPEDVKDAVTLLVVKTPRIVTGLMVHSITGEAD